jgi:hypothetical protein
MLLWILQRSRESFLSGDLILVASKKTRSVLPMPVRQNCHQITEREEIKVTQPNGNISFFFLNLRRESLLRLSIPLPITVIPKLSHLFIKKTVANFRYKILINLTFLQRPFSEAKLHNSCRVLYCCVNMLAAYHLLL